MAGPGPPGPRRGSAKGWGLRLALLGVLLGLPPRGRAGPAGKGGWGRGWDGVGWDRDRDGDGWGGDGVGGSGLRSLPPRSPQTPGSPQSPRLRSRPGAAALGAAAPPGWEGMGRGRDRDRDPRHTDGAGSEPPARAQPCQLPAVALGKELGVCCRAGFGVNRGSFGGDEMQEAPIAL